MGDMKDKAKELWKNMTQGDSPMAIGTEGKADCPRCAKEIDFSQYSNQRGDEINAGNAFSCPHCQQLLLRWEPDSARSNCADCKVKFFSFRSWNDIVRKHHCRICGKIYCNECLELCRVAGFGWEVHGNWIKLKLCKCCAKTNQETADKLEKEKAAGVAAAAEAEAAGPEAANVTVAEPADKSGYDPDAISSLHVSEPEPAKPEKRQARTTKKKTSLFDDDITFLAPAAAAAPASKPAPKKEKPAKKGMNLFDGGDADKDGLFD
eukprot:TRINITY_DN19750_c0_g1_i1.p1 TRINITY_DN19750_c0_g1~~TRINITY_DN19750_c0_g1_i1.p1  ORF type:complete len:264 (-),score=73.77 TRINITY_DN19750_c0_g1_i1:370-1161(-)